MVNVTSMGGVHVVQGGLVIPVMYLVHLGITIYHVVVKVIVYTVANVYVKGIVQVIDVSVAVQPITVVIMVYVIMVHVIVLMVGLVHHVCVIVK